MSDEWSNSDTGRQAEGTDLRSPTAGLGRRTFAKIGVIGAVGALSGRISSDSSTSKTAHRKGTLSVSPASGKVRETVTFTGHDLPPNVELSLVWNSVDGRWALAKETEIVGPQYSPRTNHVGTIRTDENGTFSEHWQLLEDYGGEHIVELRDANGTTLGTTTLTLERSFELDRTAAPLGSQFTVVAHGLGPSQYRTLYEIAWDNGFTGMVTAISTRGRAEAVVPAAGPPGQHVIKVWRGHTGFPYLNPQQSPYGAPPPGEWVVQVTEPDSPPRESWVDASRGSRPTVLLDQYQMDVHQSDAQMQLSPATGRAGSQCTLTGYGFKSDTAVKLDWITKSGSRVTSGDFSGGRKRLDTVTANHRGHWKTTFTVPDDLGGTHPIVATVNETAVAVVGYVIQPKTVGIDPIEGPVGTRFQLHLKGVGWTEFDNTYTVVYDNRYLGYACGFNSKGDVKINLTAAGQPGYHTISLFPALYEGDQPDPDFYVKPQLTYREDHPGRHLPALHFTFRVTKS